ncbi:MAG: flagellin lysine-N-methylase [Lachnospiraceae bacterium]|nr:flagellin lysine-N-methylase [Lachnospiraceae bacterium]
MRYVKPHYYEDFQCTADRCPDTCCAGWQIVIDEESLEKYSRVRGPFGNRLFDSIDWEEGSFRQQKGRCCFLDEENLCDLYKILGKDSLCRTCRMYPRHVEEYEGLRELSLSLSCPVAAEMILTCREPLRLIEEETDEAEELEEEFEDFDLLMFTQLEDARAVIFALLQDRERTMDQRIGLTRQMVEQMQKCIDEERYYDVDGVIDRFRQLSESEMPQGISMTDEPEMSRYTKMCREYTVFGRLERLRPEWSDLLDDAWMTLYEKGEDTYQEIREEFETYCADVWKEEWTLFSENLFLFFLYTYFCGAVYDDWIYSKFALAEFSVRWIQELIMARWAENGEISREDYIEIAYRYAREIEHSDENLNMLEEWLTEGVYEG